MSKTFREIVGEAIGEASTCWSIQSTGVFDSARASKLIDRIDKAALATFGLGRGAARLETFEDQLRELLNTWSIEKTSDTPDFVLCQYMAGCLEAFSAAVRRRDHWYGFKPFDANAPSNVIHPPAPVVTES